MAILACRCRSYQLFAVNKQLIKIRDVYMCRHPLYSEIDDFCQECLMQMQVQEFADGNTAEIGCTMSQLDDDRLGRSLHHLGEAGDQR